MKNFGLLIFLAIFVGSIKLYAQEEKAFNIQLNTGYTYMIGKQLNLFSPQKYGLGSFTSGQIPIGIELRYKLVNQAFWNPRYRARMSRWSNYFSDRLYLNFGYNAFVGIPYQYIERGNNFEDKYTFNLNTHTLRIGAMYDFTEDLERLFRFRMRQVSTYIGIDAVLLLQQVSSKFNPTLNNQPISGGEQATKSNLFANFGVMPKIEVEYYIPARAFGRGRSGQWWFYHGLYLNAAVQYTLIVPSKIKNFPLIDPLQQNTLNHSINFNIGVGFRF